MSYCIKCGAYIPDLDNTCPACGALKGFAAEAVQTAPAPEKKPEKKPEQAAPESGEYHYTYNYKANTSKQDAARERAEAAQAEEPAASSYEERMDEDATQNRGLGALCYLWLLFIIPLALKFNSPFVRYHANQGLVLAILWVVSELLWGVPVIGWIAALAGNLLAFVCVIKGMINAAKGRCEPLPLIGGVEIIK